MEQNLILRENAKHELMAIKDLESGVDYLNKVKAIEVWAKAEKKDAELQNIVAEQKIRTQRILGRLLKDEEVSKRGYGDQKSESAKMTPKLSDYGITKNESSTFQKIADIPDDDFEEFIAEKKDAVNKSVAELTTAGTVRFAQKLNPTKKKTPEKITPVEINVNDIPSQGLNCYKITDQCYLVGSGSLREVYLTLLSNYKFF